MGSPLASLYATQGQTEASAARADRARFVAQLHAAIDDPDRFEAIRAAGVDGLAPLTEPTITRHLNTVTVESLRPGQWFRRSRADGSWLPPLEVLRDPQLRTSRSGKRRAMVLVMHGALDLPADGRVQLVEVA